MPQTATILGTKTFDFKNSSLFSYQWKYSSLVKTAPLALVNKVPRVYILSFILVFPEKCAQILQIRLLCNGKIDQRDLWFLSKGNLLLKIISFTEFT